MVLDGPAATPPGDVAADSPADLPADLAADLEAERAGRLAAEQERDRLAVLTEVGERFATTLDPADALQLLTDQLVPRLGRWCATYLIDGETPIGGSAIKQVIAAHQDPADPQVRADLELFTRRSAATLAEDCSTKRVLRGEIPHALILRMDNAAVNASLDGDGEMTAACARLGLGSAVVAPLESRGRLLGAFHLTGGLERGDYTEADVSLIAALAHRAALALDNARLYARERSIAETMQRGLLPDVPDIPGLRIVARYLPAAQGASVGGDWFDALPLPDGATGLAIGDVMGHDIAAAASMGQLRSVLRSYAWEGAPPSVVLDRLDRLVRGLGMAELATCVYARVEAPRPDGTRLLRWANAGHPPPMLRRPDGATIVLDEVAGLLIGVPEFGGRHPERAEGSVVVAPGSVLLLYTDGAVDVPGQDLVDGIDTLRRGLTRLPAGELRNDAPETIGIGIGDSAARHDDIAVLVVAFD